MTDMSGLGLTRRFYEQVVSPLLANVPHSACLLGDGSEVLGFDDDVSTDHDFGPRVQVLVRSETDATLAVDLLTVEVLPQAFEGFPVAYADADRLSGAAHHQIDVATVAQFFRGRIGWDPIAPASLADWLTTPTQRLATLVGGEVFHDPDGSLARRRAPLQWYPDDVWRYVLAASWLRISQEEAFIGRTGSRGDDLGSALIAGRVARDLIQLTFLLERCWAPYSKWLGTAFARLPLAATVGPHLDAAMRAVGWREREQEICAAQRKLALATNRLGLAAQVDPEPRQFFDRDIRVLFGDRFTRVLTEQVTDPDVRALIDRLGARSIDGPSVLPGAIDQAIDSVDVLTHPELCRSAAAVLGLAPAPATQPERARRRAQLGG